MMTAAGPGSPTGAFHDDLAPEPSPAAPSMLAPSTALSPELSLSPPADASSVQLQPRRRSSSRQRQRGESEDDSKHSHAHAVESDPLHPATGAAGASAAAACAAPEPEWSWTLAGSRSYASYWFRAASSYVQAKFSPTRVRRDWTRGDTRTAALSLYVLLAIIFFALLFHFNSFAARVGGVGGRKPIDITCHAVGWDQCGLGGGDCLPFSAATPTALRCPPRCLLLPIDDVEGGGGVRGVYKSTSHVCHAAVHAGLVSGEGGGCFGYRPSGVRGFFPSGGESHGVSAAEFPSWFPGSMQLTPIDSVYCTSFGSAIAVLLGLACVPLCLWAPGVVLWFCALFACLWYATLTLSDRGTPTALFFAVTLNSFLLGMIAWILWPHTGAHSMYVDLSYAEEQKKDWGWRHLWAAVDRLRGKSSSKRLPECKDARTIAVVAAGSPFAGGPRVTVVDESFVPAAAGPRYISTSSASAVSGMDEPAASGVGAGGTSPLGSLHHARGTLRAELGAPLIEQPLPSPSPSPSASGSTEPAGQGVYSPPSTQGVQLRENELRRRRGVTTVAIESSAEDGFAKRALSSPSASPSVVAVQSKVMRPWYDLLFLWCFPLIFSVHFSYLVYIPGMSDINLDGSFFDHGAKGALFIIVVILIVGAVLLYTMRMAFRINVLFRYLLYYAYLAIVILVVSLMFAGAAQFHMHHLLAGMFLLPASRFPSRVSLVFQAVVTAIMINGFALWNLTGAWDMLAASGGPANRFNAPPPIFLAANATASTAVVAWPIYSNRSDVIGTSLFINDIEILHSTYLIPYGGGRTPYNASDEQPLAASQHGLMHFSRSFSRAMDDDSPSPVHAAIRQYHRAAIASPLQLHLPSKIPSLALPNYPLEDDMDWRDYSAADFDPSSSFVPRIAPRSALAPAFVAGSTMKRHLQERAALQSRSLSALPPNSSGDGNSTGGNFTGSYFLFQLENLLPNTTYIVQAGWIFNGGSIAAGLPLAITTTDQRP